MKVLLAIDGSPYSEKAIEAIIGQFVPDATQIRVLHVDEWPKDLPASLAFAEGPDAASVIVAAHDLRRAESAALVARAVDELKRAGFTSTSSAVSPGDARQTILDQASAWGADLIVLGSHGRTGVTRVLLGSVSDSVARHAPCSVMIVRGSSRTE